MFCPNCGTQNSEASKFCSNCDRALQTAIQPSGQRPPPQPAVYYTPPKPANPLASAATTGGLAGMIGGVMIVLGWLIGGGLTVMQLILVGGAVGGALGGLMDSGVGLIFGLLAIALALVVAIVPITGLLCARTGVSLFELRAYSDRSAQAISELQRLRSRATTVLVMMILMAAFVAFIPFIGNALLGRGYFLMVGGAVITFLGALFARSQLQSQAVTTIHRPKQRQLNEEERQVLWLLAEGLSTAEIAARLGVSDAYADAVRATLLSKLGAEDTAVLIKRARARGLLPPG